MTLRVLIFVSLLVAVAAQSSNHNEFRQYNCQKKRNGEGTDCTLTMKRLREETEEVTVEQNKGCFEEQTKQGEKRLFCPMFCADAFAGYFIAKVPASNTKCIKFLTYKVESRENEWYFWRSGECLNEPLQFDLGCSFSYSVKEVNNVREFLAKKKSQ
ncbi:hypothetical protein QR680_004568 [Steinernema hermaphroditum]|uniref:DUF7808 domain-containing protein n=1 Tax=Steinernema hermaphroditum TaxID=289476 RepID=A0AA39HQ92_9BILA|nr:hypothetical protein QR680_004568 [Steinernema hermaphroditum]